MAFAAGFFAAIISGDLTDELDGWVGSGWPVFIIAIVVGAAT